MHASPDIQNPSHSYGFVLALSGVAALGGFLFGFDSGVINGAVEALSVAFGSSQVATGFSVASVLLGCAVGALVAGRLADSFGRRPCMTVTACVFAVSAIGSGVASSAAELVLYRVLGGLAVGAASVLAPAYISEISPPAMRGRLASLQQLAIVLGIFAAFLSNYVIAGACGGAQSQCWQGASAWRWMFWAEVVPALLFLVGTWLIPESPRFLALQGRAEAARSLFLRIFSGDARQAEVTLAAVQESKGDVYRPRLRELLAPDTVLLPVVWVGIGLSAFQQLVGINVVFYYGELLWKSAGFTEESALLINVLTGATNILSTFVAIALIDRVGRRPLLLVGSWGMAATLAGLALVFYLTPKGTDGLPQLGGLLGGTALALANLYVISFAISWGPVVWVLLGEMFDNRIRGTALAVAASAQWLANFTVTMTFPLLLAQAGLAGAYGLYAAFALSSLVFVTRQVRETKGRSLEEIGGVVADELQPSPLRAPSSVALGTRS